MRRTNACKHAATNDTKTKWTARCLKRIRQQEHATAVVAGERSAYTPSLIYGKDSHKMPQPQEVADAVSPTETETDNPMETRYKSKMYADYEAVG